MFSYFYNLLQELFFGGMQDDILLFALSPAGGTAKTGVKICALIPQTMCENVHGNISNTSWIRLHYEDFQDFLRIRIAAVIIIMLLFIIFSRVRIVLL